MSWDELVASALVGTARRPPALPAADPESPLGQVLAAVDPDDHEGAILTAGGVLGLYRQAGARPPADTGPALPVCPPERRFLCSRAAAARLDAILDGRFRVVLGEWLDLAAAAERLVPPDRLPALLDAATTSAGLRGRVTAVVGERGRWLAGLNPAWAWATGAADDTTAWATGSAAARRLLLGRLRATDPAAARELLASTWATETPEDRAAFVGLLATGLSMDDEPFLEAALDDRRKEVRQAAAHLLWRLPDSRLAARMAERARPLVETSSLPAEVDAGMARDGVVAKPPPGTGRRAWWLQQLVAATPLRTWSGPSLVARGDPVLRAAWATAAARQGNEEWARALLDLDDVHEPALLDAVAPERAREVATGRVTRLGLTPAVLDLLDHVPQPWGPELSGAVVDRLGEAVHRPRRDPALRAKIVDLALAVDPSVPASLEEPTVWWSDVVGWFLDLLTFRAEMREELC
ncbi:MAG TPA: DUF5691 domain-containing protein [Acidimicrobiales bacterium]|nr:DUF5691 domain-containing protein [Acidimicrobiales bacterium]